jgi:hypothetical protein
MSDFACRCQISAQYSPRTGCGPQISRRGVGPQSDRPSVWGPFYLSGFNWHSGRVVAVSLHGLQHSCPWALASHNVGAFSFGELPLDRMYVGGGSIVLLVLDVLLVGGQERDLFPLRFPETAVSAETGSIYRYFNNLSTGGPQLSYQRAKYCPAFARWLAQTRNGGPS